MIKRVIWMGGGATVLGLLFFGSEAWSYLRTSAGCLRDKAQNAVPIEFQIERARRMITDLVPEVRKNMHVIAKEEVEVERLKKQIAQAETQSGKEKEQILQLKTDLGDNKNVFQYAGRSYSKDQVKVDLANRFQRFKTGEATLVSLKKIHDARERSLEAARQKLEGMLAAKRQLLVEVENLEAQRQMVAAAKTTSDYQFDDSQLGRVKALISDLQIRLDTEKKLVDAEDYFHEEIPLEAPAPENIVEQVTTYFAQPAPKAEVVAKQ
jgi:hypothetical protein